MRTEMLALLPGLIALWVTFNRSLEAAFLSVYLPVLLLIPDNFRMPIDGLPDPTFAQAAILPIGCIVCWKAVFQRAWTFSMLDAVVFSYVVWQFASDFYNVGLVDAQNLGFDMVTLALFPYICGKALIESANLRSLFARRFVWLLFIVSILSMYEFRMGFGLFRLPFRPFFPGQGAEWITQLRWGFGRVAGPYGHAILMGTILAMAFLLLVWLARSGQWEQHFKVLGETPIRKQVIIGAVILLAMGMTLSRGPWLGGMCGLVLAWAGASDNPRKAIKIACLALLIIGVAAYVGGKAFIAPPPTDALHVSSGHTVSEVEQSTAYRAQLFDKYVDITMQHPVWGWGRANWPRVPGMWSIDNNYLFVALTTGLVGLGLFLTMLIMSTWRLVLSGLSADQEFNECTFHFTMAGIIAVISVSIISVYMGSQMFPLLFLFLGWADAVTLAQFEKVKAEQAEQNAIAIDLVGVVV